MKKDKSLNEEEKDPFESVLIQMKLKTRLIIYSMNQK